jgi:hypothetical protein
MVRLPLEKLMRAILRRRSPSSFHRITFHFRLFGRALHESRFPQMRTISVLAVFAVVATLDVACAAPRVAADATQLSGSQLSGSWGGTQVAMDIEGGVATLHFPCAAGRIDEPIVLDASGAFDVPGTLRRLRGVRHIDRENQPEPMAVRYSGKVTGGQLALTLHFPDANAENEHYTLKRGEAAHVPACAALRIDAA